MCVTFFSVSPSFSAPNAPSKKKAAAQSVDCDPPATITISDITATGALVSWASAPEAIRYYVYYKIAGSGSEYSVQVAGLSYPLTGLKPCHTYQVRIKSVCPEGSDLIYSDFSAPQTFNTQSSNPSCALSYEIIDGGCGAVIGATEGFCHYHWYRNATDSVYSADTNAVYSSLGGTYRVWAIDSNGCAATDTIVLQFSAGRNCITREYDEAIYDSVVEDSTEIRNDANLLAFAMATVMQDSLVKVKVKNLALSYDKPYYAPLGLLQDTLALGGYALCDTLRSRAYALGVGAGDTARLCALLQGRIIALSPACTLRASIFSPHLDPELAEDLPFWDGLSPFAVSASAMSQSPPYRGHANPYSLYYLDSDTVAQTSQYISAWEGEPTWQIVYTSDFDNLIDAIQPIGVGAKMSCGCARGITDNTYQCRNPLSSGCKPCDGHSCTGWEKVKTIVYDVFH
jgi:hypothetical protein